MTKKYLEEHDAVCVGKFAASTQTGFEDGLMNCKNVQKKRNAGKEHGGEMSSFSPVTKLPRLCFLTKQSPSRAKGSNIPPLSHI